MRTITARGGLTLPVLGLGTWRMGEDGARRKEEVHALQLGLDLGMTLIDTAEMYADGGAEDVVGEAIRDRRDDVVLVSKVLPQNASRAGTIAAAERSLRRMKTDHIDLYLLHWTSSHPLEETLAAFQELMTRGTIRHFGVSNFDRDDLNAAEALPAGAGAANQVVYNLQKRSMEARVLPWCREHDVGVMAYSPLDQARLQTSPGLARVAERHGATPEQIAVAWTIREPGVITIPKSSNPAHVRANAGAAQIQLTEDDLSELDSDYPPPQGSPPLESL